MLTAAALAAAINAPTQTPRLAHTVVAGEVYDLDSQRVLYARNANMLMVPASTTKLLTEGTSLALLGPNFRWTTPVYRTGALDAQGVLHGDLVLVASGDPNLSQRIQPDGTLAFENEDHAYDGSAETQAVPGDPLAVLRDLAAHVAKAGIKRVEGVQVDTSLFPDQGAEGGTGTTLSPIVVNDNIVDITADAGCAPRRPGRHQGLAADAVRSVYQSSDDGHRQKRCDDRPERRRSRFRRKPHRHDRRFAAGRPQRTVRLSRA